MLGQASGVGNLAVLLGSTTGRDGIGGVSVLAGYFGGAQVRVRPDVIGERNLRVVGAGNNRRAGTVMPPQAHGR